ncbi:MAG: 6-phospho-beta-glucosidase [Clostridia bacterium]|nr:6-phospho-beta-glucosidase [Clostridia bacterium]
MKLTVIGGGGVRSMFLAKSLAQKAQELDIDKLYFMDTDPEKLRIYGAMAQKVAKLLAPRLLFTCTESAEEALDGADYVITTIRVGGDRLRALDERAALDLGVLGQETTGAAGFSFAMRSIPALLEYCELAKKYSKPNVHIFNFTNPAGLVSQALWDAGYAFAHGICDAPSGMLNAFAKMLQAEPGRVRGELYGLNHLSFFSEVTLDGKNILPALIENDASYRQTDLRYFSKELLRRKQFIPNEYLYYYFSSSSALKHILEAEETRGEQICRINRLMTAALRGKDVANDFDSCLKIFEHYYGLRENSYMASETGVSRETKWSFNPFDRDAGGYAGVALRYIEIAGSGKTDSMILCAPNKGAIPGLEDDDVIEATCDVTPDGPVPHRFERFDEDALELIRRVKYYERKAARAILDKNAADAADALALHPLVNDHDIADKLMARFLEINGAYAEGWN